MAAKTLKKYKIASLCLIRRDRNRFYFAKYFFNLVTIINTLTDKPTKTLRSCLIKPSQMFLTPRLEEIRVMTVDNINKAGAIKWFELENHNNKRSIFENGLQPIFIRR